MNEYSFIFAPVMRKKDENKEIAIREKAIEMIVKEGFDGLSMQKLAKAANVSPATIYIYFKNREDMLNQLFNHVEQTFTRFALNDFDPQMTLKEGLWLQWRNRLRFISKNPYHYGFHEQFRNSHLIDHNDVKRTDFKDSMKTFVINAVKCGELKKMEPEIFWALAYGPFYTLVKFHLQKKSMMNNNFKLTESKMKMAFDCVMKALDNNLN